MAIGWAAKYAHINVLDWFDKSVYKFKYNHTTIDLVAANAHINVLE